MKNKLKVLFTAAEAAPLAKVGGLGDVVGSLPKALLRLGIDVRIFLPLYGSIDRKKLDLKLISKNIIIETSAGNEKFSLWQTRLPHSRLIVYLIDHRFFSGKEIYRKNKFVEGSVGIDDIKKFTFFSCALLEAAKLINFQPNIIHLNDCHVAAVLDFLKTTYLRDNFFKKVKTLYTIHNLASQNVAKPEIIGFSKLDPDLPVIKADLADGDINFMVQGILGADLVSTVSPTYSREILTHYQGAGLEKILEKRRKDLSGITNGIDTAAYDPATDRAIKKRYSLKTVGGKTANKLSLQKKLGWPADPKLALVGVVTRLVWQKGMELLSDRILKLPARFVILGTGSQDVEDRLTALAKAYPDKLAVRIGFDEKLARQIYAAADLFLVPSRFEPCGLTQMIAMRYGTVPVVRKTGGLSDTVDPAVGFAFKKYDREALFKCLKSALDAYYNEPVRWKKLQKTGMKQDFSWDRPAKEYLKLYKKLLKIS